MALRECSIDIEGTGLLNEEAIDYSSMPYKLKPTFKIHCVVLQDIKTNDIFVLYDDPQKRTPKQIKKEVEVFGTFDKPVVYMEMKHLSTVLSRCSRLIAHNGINYDYLAMALHLDCDYEVGKGGLAFQNGEWPSRDEHHYDRWDNNPINLEDTLIMSQLLNPDRFGGHSLEEWGVRLGRDKVDVVDYVCKHLDMFNLTEADIEGLGKAKKKELCKKAYFKTFTPHMIHYCIVDTILCKEVYFRLKREWGKWDWTQPYCLETMVSDIITRQSHLGFKFDEKLGKWCHKDLTNKMQEIEQVVNPQLPQRKLTKGEEGNYTPPVRQVKQDRTMSSSMQRWLERHGGHVTESREEEVGKRVIKTLTIPTKLFLYGEERDFPLPPEEAVISGLPMTLKHHTELKEYIVSLGWEPTEWNISDLTMKNQKKIRKTQEEYEASVSQYLLKKNSPFLPFVLEEAGVDSYEKLVKLLLNHNLDKPMKVLSSPKYTIGQQKELDPALEKLGEKGGFIGDVVKWLTYNHRRNAILSKVEDSISKEEDSGWLTHLRLEVDGRIPTPAVSVGCNTSRMRHIDVANVARVSSLYGEYMRALFGVGNKDFQIGYDADSLEGRVEGHYCHPYDSNDKPYVKSLTAQKPNDLHTRTASKISEVLGKEFDRDSAKSVKYGCSYGAQVNRVSKIVGCSHKDAERIFDTFWEAAKPLERLKKKVEKKWKYDWDRKYVPGIDKRKVPTRSMHSLLNSLFQSCGVIAMKYAMVWADRELKKLKLVGNVFKEDIYGRPTTNQMISYHKQHCGLVQ